MVHRPQTRQRLTTNGIDYEEQRKPLPCGGFVRPFIYQLRENALHLEQGNSIYRRVCLIGHQSGLFQRICDRPGQKNSKNRLGGRRPGEYLEQQGPYLEAHRRRQSFVYI